MKKSITEAAIEIFEKEGKPLHYKELTKMLLGECNLSGKTPHESVRSKIGMDYRFKRVAEGVYALSEWEQYPTARFAKDIAYDVLNNFGKLISLNDLGEEIFKERIFVGSPKLVARNAIRKDKRFYIESGSDLVGLVEWLEEDKNE